MRAAPAAPPRGCSSCRSRSAHGAAPEHRAWLGGAATAPESREQARGFPLPSVEQGRASVCSRWSPALPDWGQGRASLCPRWSPDVPPRGGLGSALTRGTPGAADGSAAGPSPLPGAAAPRLLAVPCSAPCGVAAVEPGLRECCELRLQPCFCTGWLTRRLGREKPNRIACLSWEACHVAPHTRVLPSASAISQGTHHLMPISSASCFDATFKNYTETWKSFSK